MPQTQPTGLLAIWTHMDAEYTEAFVQWPHAGAEGQMV